MKVSLNAPVSNVKLAAAAKLMGLPDCQVVGAEIFSENKELPRAIIVNLERSFEGGTHWVALYSGPDRIAYYFDSYGAPPCDEAEQYADRRGITIHWNDRVVQSDLSAACGWFALAFLLVCAGAEAAGVSHLDAAKGFAARFNTGSNSSRAGNLQTLRALLTRLVPLSP